MNVVFATSKIAMPEALMGNHQEDPLLREAFVGPKLNPLLLPSDRIHESTGAI